MITLNDITAKVAPATLESKNIAAITNEFNVGRTRVQPKLGGIGLVLETLGAEAGAALLDALQAQTSTVPALKWAWYLIERGELDFGSAATRTMIDELVPSPAKEALLAVAEVPDPVSERDITITLINDNGTWSI